MEEEHFWTIEFWPFNDRSGPANKEMRAIKSGNSDLHRSICRVLLRQTRKLVEEVIRGRFLKDLKNGLYELSITVKDFEFRMLGPVEYPENGKPRLVCLHCLIKKEQKLRKADIEVALGRLKKYNKERKDELH